MSDKKEIRIATVRRAVANYMATEGCDCCRDIDGHKKAKKHLAKLLNVPMYYDKSGFDFDKFRRKADSAKGVSEVL